MAKPEITWSIIRELALQAGVDLTTYRSWKHRGDVPKAARYDLMETARKRRWALTGADFDHLGSKLA